MIQDGNLNMNQQVNPVEDIIKTVNEMTGIEINDEKFNHANTKILHHSEKLQFKSIKEYYNYFLLNKENETKKIISLLTNHTTEFFRETEHFDYLAEEFFPKFIKEKKAIRIWSAAASTGQEAYSIAITYLETCEELGVSPEQAPPIEIIGTDIDEISIEKCENGIYLKKSVEEQIGKTLIKKYFDYGKDDLKDYVRVKENVHKLCHFKTQNLFRKPAETRPFDLIMIRNALIYYTKNEVQKIISIIQEFLEPSGYLILGHSESLRALNVPFTLIKNAIYQHNYSVNYTDLTNVFIIDDSKTIRNFLKSILTEPEGFQVVGEAENPIEAMKIMPQLKSAPHVLTLDINMPEMSGIEYLEKIKGRMHPPIVVMSSISQDDARGGIKCLELGAFDYIEKPQKGHLAEDVLKIKNILKQARSSKIKLKTPNGFITSSKSSSKIPFKPDLIAIGASTGGVEALQSIFTKLKKGFPPIVVVQHIPEKFSATLAARLNELSALEIIEGRNNQQLVADCVYLAPGGRQMKIVERDDKLFIEINDSERVNLHKPSVDYLFNSLTHLSKKTKICALLLTGMGSDGARGLKALYQKNAYTIAQDEESSIVFGMPREAIAMGAVHQISSLTHIPTILNNSIES